MSFFWIKDKKLYRIENFWNLIANNHIFVFMRVTQGEPDLLFQQVFIDRSGAHHFDLILQNHTFVRDHVIFLRHCLCGLTKRDQTSHASLSVNQVINEIKGQTHTDQKDQILADEISVLIQLVHTAIESHLQTVDKSKNAIESVV